jgi:hypothetical protein
VAFIGWRLTPRPEGSGEAAQSAALWWWLLILAVLLHGVVSIQRGGRVLDVKRVGLPIVGGLPCDLLPFCLFELLHFRFSVSFWISFLHGVIIAGAVRLVKSEKTRSAGKSLRMKALPIKKENEKMLWK